MNNLVAVDDLILSLNQMTGVPGFNSNLADEFKKALTSTSGYVGYNLEREVKMRLPAYTVLRNRVAVDAAPLGAMAGPQAHFKMQLGYAGFDFGAGLGTAFGANGPDGNPSATDIGADYKSQSITTWCTCSGGRRRRSPTGERPPLRSSRRRWSGWCCGTRSSTAGRRCSATA